MDAEDVDACVKGSIKNKKAQVTDSLFGMKSPHQISLIKGYWEHIEYMEKSITRMEEEIHAHLQPYRTDYELLQTNPGVSELTTAAFIAEIGVDME